MDLYTEFFGTVEELNRRKVPYAVVGGIAVSFYTTPRFTKDIDLLVKAVDEERVREALRAVGFLAENKPWTFRNTNITLIRFSKFSQGDHVTVDVMLGNEDAHTQVVEKAIRTESDQGPVYFARREDIIWLKQFRDSPLDRADIEMLQDDQS